MRRSGERDQIVTDWLPSYRAALRGSGAVEPQATGRWSNDTAKSSRRPLRRREWPMPGFRRRQSPQEFAAVHCSVHDPFNRERRLSSKDNLKLAPSAALAGWRQLGTAWDPRRLANRGRFAFV